VAYMTLLKWGKQQLSFAENWNPTPQAEEDALGEDVNPDVARVVQHLGAVEHSLDFQMHLLAAMTQIAADTSYSEDNFAYGSTPFSSWCAVFESPKLAATMVEMASGNDGDYVVFGSSIGWLAFYGACCCGVNTVGVEIMEYLVQVADDTRAKLCIEKIRFSQGDMLQHSLAETKVLMLTSQCWDDILIAKVYCKLAGELTPGALVVDYRGTLAESHSTEFELVEKVVTPVSWNPQQAFFIFQRL